MLFQAVSGLAVVVALLVAVMMIKLLWRKQWFLGWLRGICGMLLLAATLFFLAVAWDMWGYRQVLSETTIATLSFDQVEPQYYRVTLTESNGTEREFELHGDQWQLDAKMIKPAGALARWGVKPAYRLDRLSGRYYTLEDERNAPRSLYQLEGSLQGLDVWQWLKSPKLNISWIDATYGNAAYVPMEDGALYEVNLTFSGLIARPLNRQAKLAVERWQ